MTAARDFGRPRPRVSRFGLPPTAAPHRREIAYDSQEPRPFQLAVGSLRQAILSVNRRFWRDFELWHHPRGQRRGRAPAPGQGGGPRAGRHGDRHWTRRRRCRRPEAPGKSTRACGGAASRSSRPDRSHRYPGPDNPLPRTRRSGTKHQTIRSHRGGSSAPRPSNRQPRHFPGVGLGGGSASDRLGLAQGWPVLLSAEAPSTLSCCQRGARARTRCRRSARRSGGRRRRRC